MAVGRTSHVLVSSLSHFGIQRTRVKPRHPPIVNMSVRFLGPVSVPRSVAGAHGVFDALVQLPVNWLFSRHLVIFSTARQVVFSSSFHDVCFKPHRTFHLMGAFISTPIGFFIFSPLSCWCSGNEGTVEYKGHFFALVVCL